MLPKAIAIVTPTLPHISILDEIVKLIFKSIYFVVLAYENIVEIILAYVLTFLFYSNKSEQIFHK